MEQKEEPKQKRKYNRRKPLSQSKYPLNTEALVELTESENLRLTNKNLELYSLPKIDMTKAEQVQERIAEYFRITLKYDSKPTLTGLAMALGIDRRRLWEIKTGNHQILTDRYRNLPQEVTDVIRRTYDYLEIMWEDYMLNGKINPVSGIFLAKNFFGYQDKIDYVVTPNSQKEDFNAEEIKKRYLKDPDIIDQDSF